MDHKAAPTQMCLRREGSATNVCLHKYKRRGALMRKTFCITALIAAAVATTSCTTTGEAVRFQARQQQQTLMRDGGSMIMSQGRFSTVSLKPATRLVGSRPVFIVGIQNNAKIPLDFRVSNTIATQIVDGQPFKELRVYTYDELVAEEQQAQIGRAVLVGVLGGVNAGLAGRNHYAQNRAAAQNEEMAARVAVAGEQNLAVLEQQAIKDHTVLPGEQYAGKLSIEAPVAETAGAKQYSIILTVGTDRHEIQVIQEATR